MNIKLTKIEKYLLFIPLLFVIAFKAPHLGLPYFWDEAWSYFPAVYKMYETGPGLLPGDLPLWLAKGHPLFFFFIASSWMRLTGTSVFWVHVLPLLISLGTLTSLYFLLKKHVNGTASIIAVLLLSVQSLFLAQAAMLLPEMMITLLLVLSTDMYLRKKYIAWAVIASAMVLTKETSIVFVGGFLLFHLLTYLKRGKESHKYIRESILLLSPVFIYALFLFLHKKEFGSYLFQDHVGYIKLDRSSILHKLEIASTFIFLRYGRNVIFFTLLAALIYTLFRDKKVEHGKLLGLLLLQIIIFLLFSSVNFYTHRYMLSLMTLFIIGAAVILRQARLKNNIINAVVIICITGIPLYFTFTKKSNADSDLGYIEVVKTHQKMVEFCEEKKWHDKPVAASFNLIFCLRNPHLGYLSDEKGFSDVKNLGRFRDSEIFLFESTGADHKEEIDTIKQEYIMIKEHRIKHAWGEIYADPSIPQKKEF